jgi:hypothetical protein
MGQRVSAEIELEGLDIPEIGSLAYPEFVLRPTQTPPASVPVVQPPLGAPATIGD